MEGKDFEDYWEVEIAIRTGNPEPARKRSAVECEVIRLNDQVALDIGPSERVVAIEVLDASELIPGLKEKRVSLENLAVSS